MGGGGGMIGVESKKLIEKLVEKRVKEELEGLVSEVVKKMIEGKRGKLEEKIRKMAESKIDEFVGQIENLSSKEKPALSQQELVRLMGMLNEASVVLQRILSEQRDETQPW